MSVDLAATTPPATRDGATRRDVTLDDFMTGLIAALAAEGIRVVSIRGQQFYAAVQRAFEALEASQGAEGLRLRFWLTLNRIHGDSADVREGITKAVQRDLVSLDNPVYLDMRLKVGASESASYLKELPGRPEVYQSLAKAFLEEFSVEDF